MMIQSSSEVIKCAMWLALGRQTKFSRSGFDIVFNASSRSIIGSPCVSENIGTALAQLAKVGVVTSVTQIELNAYREWSYAREQRLKDKRQKIIVTKKFDNNGIAKRSVKYVDGLQTKARVTIECLADDRAQIDTIVHELRSRFGVKSSNIKIH